MEQKYQVVTGKQDISHLINQLHKEEVLAIGIMDTGTRDELEQTLGWYVQYFNHELYVITQKDRIPADVMQVNYPDVTFIVFDKAPDLAERVNALADECMTTYFLLTRSDTALAEFNWEAISAKMRSEIHPAVLCPLVFNKDKELVPTVRAPRLDRNGIDPLSLMPSSGTDQNLYPFLGLGLYDRALFQRLRGFDGKISGAYWQTLDFGTRCWLYGYPVLSVNDIAILFFSKQFLFEDRSETAGVERFYTKALCVNMVHGRTKVKKNIRTDKRVLANEVKPRAGLYRTDFKTLCATWKLPDEN